MLDWPIVYIMINNNDRIDDMFQVLRRINRKNYNSPQGGRRYDNHPKLKRDLLGLQYLLNMLLDCKTAFAGSTGLYLQGEVEKFGDIDVLTNRMFTSEEFEELIGITPDNESKHGFQFHKTSLDIFFVSRPDNQSILELANYHTTTIDNIRVQSAEFIKQVNYYWQGGDEKQRLTAEPTIFGLGEAL